AADEGDRIVDHDELLVVRSAERVARVEAKADATVCPQSELEERQRLPIERVDHREVPREDVDVEPAAAPHEAIEELDQGLAGPVRSRSEAHLTVDVPAEDEDRVLRFRGGAPERVE